MDGRERRLPRVPGPVMAGVVVGLAAVAVWAFATQRWATGAVAVVLGALLAPGFEIVQPNQGEVAILLGRYAGTLRDDGLWWVNPLTVRRPVSLRVRNLDSSMLKVNDAVGNPVEIAAVINWRVVDTARALLDVDDYERFVAIQAEASVRHVASEYPYDDLVVLVSDRGIQPVVNSGTLYQG